MVFLVWLRVDSGLETGYVPDMVGGREVWFVDLIWLV